MGLLFYPVRVCCRRASNVLQCGKHSTAQHSVISPHNAAKQVRADQSATTQAKADREHLQLYCSTASTAQHSTAQSARTKPRSKYVPIRVRQRKQKQTESIYSCIAVPQAQHSAISPHKAAKQARTDQRATTQAKADRVGESQHMSSSFYTAH